MIPKVKITKKSRTSQFGLNGQYFAAVVIIDNSTYHYTKGEKETKWYCDAIFRGGVPIICHGEGSRCCLKEIAPPALHSLLDETVTSAV